MPAVSEITVQMYRNDLKYEIDVKLRSRMKPHILTRGTYDPGLADSPRDLLHRIGVLCAAVAENQNTLHGDNHDPSDCYNIGVGLMQQVCQQMSSGAKNGKATNKESA